MVTRGSGGLVAEILYALLPEADFDLARLASLAERAL